MQIALAGAPGSGKSTVGKLLSQHFKLPYFSCGQKRGELALKLGLTIDEVNNLAKSDHTLEFALDDWLKEQGQNLVPGVYDGLMAWHFLPQSFKLQLTVNPQIAADRIFTSRKNSSDRPDEPDYQSPANTQATIVARHQANRDRLQKLYGVDIDNPANFDLVVNTSDKTPEEILQIILNKLNSTAN